MSLILNIETTGEPCSVALSKNSVLLSLKEVLTPKAHSSQLTLLIEACVHEVGFTLHDLSAVAVSGGPGSYTGIRIGVVVAKGLCFSQEIPLIAINTLEALASTLAIPGKNVAVGIRARADEYFFALYDDRLNVLTSPGVKREAEILSILGQETNVVISSTLSEVPGIDLQQIIPCRLSAASLVYPSYERFVLGQFDSLISFQPEYLKGAFVSYDKF